MRLSTRRAVLPRAQQGKPRVSGNAAAPSAGQNRAGPRKMPSSPLREAFEIISHLLLYNEEFGVRVNAARLSIEEEVEIDPDYAIAEAVRTGLVEEYVDPNWPIRILRRGPRNAEMLRWIYGRGGPPTMERIIAAERASRKRREAEEARLEAIREAGRPRERNTVASLPAWVP